VSRPIGRRVLLGLSLADRRAGDACGIGTPEPRAAGGEPAEEVLGVVERADGDRVDVRADGSLVLVHAADAADGLRPGDRVLVGRDPGTGNAVVTPLLWTAQGRLERLGPDRVVVGGDECLLDDRSMAFDATGPVRRTLGPPATCEQLHVGVRVTVLCVDNHLDGTRTVRALNLLEVRR
jgi:hypothetical protein